MTYLILSMLIVAIMSALVILKASRYLFDELKTAWIWYHQPAHAYIPINRQEAKVETFHSEILYTADLLNYPNYVIYNGNYKIEYIINPEKKKALVRQKAIKMAENLLEAGFFKIEEREAFSVGHYLPPDVQVIDMEIKVVRPERTNY